MEFYFDQLYHCVLNSFGGFVLSIIYADTDLKRLGIVLQDAEKNQNIP